MTALADEFSNGPLAAELAPLIAAGDDAAILDVLYRRDIPAKKTITAHDIQQYLMLYDLLLPIEASQAPSCVAASRALDIFPQFDLSNPVILNKFEQILDGLVAETLIPDFTGQHKSDILSLGNALISRAEQLSIQPTLTDIRALIWNDDGSRKL